MIISGSDTVMVVAVTSETPHTPKAPKGWLHHLESRVLAELSAVIPVMPAASIFVAMVSVNCGAAQQPIDSHTTL